MSDEYNSRYKLYALILPCDYFNVDAFLRSALKSAIMNCNVGRLRRFLTSQEDAEGEAINFMFKKACAYRESGNVPRHAEMTLRKIWHLEWSLKQGLKERAVELITEQKER